MPHTDEPNTKEWLTVHEAAQVLRVSVSTLRRWNAAGDLVASRTPGGHYRYRREDLDAAIRV